MSETDSIKSYNMADTETMQPAEAVAVLDKIHAESAGDSQHPWTNSRHPQHIKYLGYIERLHKKKAVDTTESKEITQSEMPFQQRRNTEAGQLADDLGYEQTVENVNPAQLKTLKQYQLAGQSEFSLLAGQFEVDLKHLKYPQDIVRLVDTFGKVPSKNLAKQIIGKISELKTKMEFVI